MQTESVQVDYPWFYSDLCSIVAQALIKGLHCQDPKTAATWAWMSKLCFNVSVTVQHLCGAEDNYFLRSSMSLSPRPQSAGFCRIGQEMLATGACNFELERRLMVSYKNSNRAAA